MHPFSQYDLLDSFKWIWSLNRRGITLLGLYQKASLTFILPVRWFHGKYLLPYFTHLCDRFSACLLIDRDPVFLISLAQILDSRFGFLNRNLVIPVLVVRNGPRIGGQYTYFKI